MKNRMHDLISRAEALEIIEAVKNVSWSQSGKVLCSKMYSQIKDLPSAKAVNAAPVKHGHWKDNGNGTVSCSCCATWFPKEREPYLLYCGYCMARMDSGRSDDNG